MSDKDGVAKNLGVVLKGISDFRGELQKIDREVAQAWVTTEMRSFSATIGACENGQQRGEAFRLLGEMARLG